MILTEDFKNLTIRELIDLSVELDNLNKYKSSVIADLLNQLYYQVSDTIVNIIPNKTENNTEIIFEK